MGFYSWSTETQQLFVSKVSCPTTFYYSRALSRVGTASIR